ncbi:Imm50 family immunity protein [Streptomyces sp. AP-93]|uniref:Imm50 family immunity protein n=1 Tax=Streptomyces sp. AP-93 TaxID=2929048 RepID=UPI001FB0331C|nr:Imm50 family immunity protein [Streptomyces sp. AP-93]MCJ0874670.1 immunity 50 family protein [Streptomyces sp. AP-93]
MITPDWSSSLVDPRAIREVLGSPPPPLTDYDLLSVHIDERESSVTLGFFAFGFPAGAAAQWEAKGHNAVEFFLICTGVEDLAVDGWSIDPFTFVSLTGSHLELGGDGNRMSFRAAHINADTPVGRLASRVQ